MAENGVAPDCDFPLARERFWASASRPQRGAEGAGMRGTNARVPPVQLSLGRQVSAPPSLQSPSPKAQLTALSIPSALSSSREGDQQGSELQVRKQERPSSGEKSLVKKSVSLGSAHLLTLMRACVHEPTSEMEMCRSGARSERRGSVRGGE